MRSQTVNEGSFVFGPFVFLPDRQMLLKGEKEVRLGSRAVDILHLLVSRAGDLVTKEDLIAHTWPSTFVDESNLKVHISSLRRALGETRPHATYIATVAGRGYRFAAQVLVTSAKGPGEFSAGASRVGLPAEPKIVGRDREIRALARSVTSGRVVTLAGPVGVGKASVARTAAASIVSGFDAGSCIVDFSMMGDPSGVSNFIAATLGLRAKSTDMTAALLDYLEHRRMLIILDHCERVAVALRLFVSRFVAGLSPSTILAVSLEPLQVPDECVHRIGLLSYPDYAQSVNLSKQAALEFPAVLMLVERARELTGYELKNNDLQTVVGLCQIMDGRPRSISSALSNLLPQFSLAEMLEILTRLFLYGPQPGEPEVPECLMSRTTDFGYSRLSSGEVALFKQLSVFCGSFELEDAVAMTSPFGWDAHQTLMALGNLVAKSLLCVESNGRSVAYRLLGAERFFARARLHEAPAECRRARMLHARVMLRVFEQARDEWAWSKPETWRGRYLGRSEDLLQAIEWAADDGTDARLVVALTEAAIKLWDEQSQMGARRTCLERALQFGECLPDLIEARSRIATSHAWSLTFSGDLGERTSRAWLDAVDIAVKSQNDTNYLSAVFGYCTYLFVTGQNRQVRNEIVNFDAVVAHSADHGFLVDLERLRYSLALDAGDVIAARDGFDNLARRVRTDSPPSNINRYRWERYVTIHANLALAKSLTDDSDETQDMIALLEDRVALACPPGAQAVFFILAALPIAYWRRDAIQLERLTDLLRVQHASDQVVLTRPVIQLYEAVTRHLQGQTCSLDHMQDLVAQLADAGHHRRSSLHLCMIAEAALELGETTRAAQLLARAFEQHERCQEMWYLPELIRVEARLATANGDPEKAASLWHTATSQAIRMGLRLFERRIQFDPAAVQESAIELAGPFRQDRNRFTTHSRSAADIA